MASKRRIRRLEQKTCQRKKAYPKYWMGCEKLRQLKLPDMHVYPCHLARTDVSGLHFHIGHVPGSTRKLMKRKAA